MTVLIQDKSLKVGDKICVIGDTTGIVYSTIERMEIDKKPVEFVSRGEEVGIKIPKVRKGDQVYIIVENQDHK